MCVTKYIGMLQIGLNGASVTKCIGVVCFVVCVGQFVLVLFRDMYRDLVIRIY